MTEFPMPDLGANLAEFITAATNYISLINEHHYIDILIVFVIIVNVVVWAIGRIKSPPEFPGG